VIFKHPPRVVRLAWKPEEICFAQPDPRTWNRSGNFSGHRCGSMPNTCGRFPAYWLQNKLPDTSPELRRLLQNADRRAYRATWRQFPEQVRSVLRGAPPDRSCVGRPGRSTVLDDPAYAHARLSAFDTGFHELVDEIRFESRGRCSKTRGQKSSRSLRCWTIAGPNAFTRAFRRWSGRTPAKWRTKTKGKWLGGFEGLRRPLRTAALIIAANLGAMLLREAAPLFATAD